MSQSNLPFLTAPIFYANVRRLRLTYVGGTSGNQYYELSNGTLILKSGNFPAAGEYVLHLVAQGYANKTLSIPIMEAESEGNGHGGGSEGTGSGESGGSGNAGEPGGGSGALSAVPGVAEVNYQRTGRMPYVRFVELVFDNSVSAEDAYAFINHPDAEVKVNGVRWTKAGGFDRYSSNQYIPYDNGTMDFHADSLKDAENTIEISVEGYALFSYVYIKKIEAEPSYRNVAATSGYFGTPAHLGN